MNVPAFHSCGHRPWSRKIAVSPEDFSLAVAELSVTSACVRAPAEDFLRSICKVTSRLNSHIYTPKMRPVAGSGGEKAIWGATELIAVRILWEVLALYIIPSLGMVGLIFPRRRGVLFVLTELGGAEEELGS